MSNHGNLTRRSVAVLALCSVVLLWGAAPVGASDEVDVLDLVRSFQSLGVLDPVAAGSVWMTDAVAEVWNSFVAIALFDSVEAIALFGHSFWLTHTSDDGSLFGGLYNPWIDSLIVFRLNDRATEIDGVAMLTTAAWTGHRGDPQALALALMDAVEAADRQFAEALGDPFVSNPTAWSTIAGRIDAYLSDLRWVYGADIDGTRAQENVSQSIDQLLSGRMDGVLSLLAGEDPDWIQSLVPVWLIRDAGGQDLLCVSPDHPLDFVSMAISNASGVDPITSVSWIRLFDRVSTRGGDGS